MSKAIWRTYNGFGRDNIVQTMPNPLTPVMDGPEVVFCRNYNGSGPTAFGGMQSWPVATCKVSFPEGREDLRDGFAEALKVFIDNYFTGLET